MTILLCSFSYGNTGLITVDYSSSMGVLDPTIFGTTINFETTEIAFSLLSSGGFGMAVIPYKEDSPTDPTDYTQYGFISRDSIYSQMFKYGVPPQISFYLVSPPSSYSNYSIFVQNVIRHYKEGWGNGFFYPIQYIRFGNEPDGGTTFWSGTQDEFFKTFQTVANSVKSLDSTLILQGPGLRTVVNPFTLTPLSYTTEFLNYCRDSGVPLDCFSFHAYDPILYYDYYKNWVTINNFLSNYSTLSPLFGKPQLANDEWNLELSDFFTGFYQAQLDTAWTAAHNVAALIYMINGGMRYSTRIGGPFIFSSEQHDFNMVNYPDYSPKPVYYGMKAVNSLSSTQQLFTLGSDSANLAVMSGKSSNDTIALVIAYYDTYSYLTIYHPDTTLSQWQDYRRTLTDFGITSYQTYQGATVLLKNLNWTDTTNQIVMERYLVDDTTKLEKIDTQYFTASSTVTAYVPLTAPSVQLLIFYQQAISVPVELSEFFAIAGDDKKK